MSIATQTKCERIDPKYALICLSDGGAVGEVLAEEVTAAEAAYTALAEYASDSDELYTILLCMRDTGEMFPLENARPMDKIQAALYFAALDHSEAIPVLWPIGVPFPQGVEVSA